MISFVHKGNFKSTEQFLFKLHSKSFYENLDRYAREGVKALQSVTPVDTGNTANSWGYPEPIEFSWDFSSQPVKIALASGALPTGAGGFRATSLITIDSRKITAAQKTALENMLWGGVDPSTDVAHLPLPLELYTTLSAAV